ncbi:MAG: hypothetical protein ACYTAO_06650 [Planctomycetota bacterium]
MRIIRRFVGLRHIEGIVFSLREKALFQECGTGDTVSGQGIALSRAFGNGGFCELSAGRCRLFLSVVPPGLGDRRLYEADYLFKTGQTVNKKFDFHRENTILFDSVNNRAEETNGFNRQGQNGHGCSSHRAKIQER